MKILAENRKASFDYEFLEKMEAGLSLLGQEVKSLRIRGASLAGSYITIRTNEKTEKAELFWIGGVIAPYQVTNLHNIAYDPKRDRKLLLKREEIAYLTGKIKERGLTLVPIMVYTRKHKIKMELALARGKKTHDKRESIKKKDVERRMREELKARG
ncbi:MAG: SsrA-binding protein SmpB [Candidatus Pacebacteria bacterium]|nr:SsrA-binding protein SmpB [Candidatus Paceibacterota bacterium]